MAVLQKKFYFLRLRGTKKGQECASIEHLETFSMPSSARQRRNRGTSEEQKNEQNEWNDIGNNLQLQEVHEINN